MTKRIFPFVLMGAAMTLSGCLEGALEQGSLGPYNGNPNSIIATNTDSGRDAESIADGHAAIVYDPDGCQAWMIDDGVEGFAGRRFDPKSGLPICNNRYAPGTVLGEYQSDNSGIRDYVPNNGG